MTAPTLSSATDVRDRSGAYAVIGAGPHGLSGLKALRQYGLDADGFERAGDVGGNWNFGAPTSRVYESTHLISSKPFTQFPDFPMPDSFPDYPSHRHIKEYFNSYADHFGLREHISFNTEVVSVVPADGAGYIVTVRDVTTGTTYASTAPSTEISPQSFCSATKSLSSAGVTRRAACGRTTSRMVRR